MKLGFNIVYVLSLKRTKKQYNGKLLLKKSLFLKKKCCKTLTQLISDQNNFKFEKFKLLPKNLNFINLNTKVLIFFFISIKTYTKNKNKS